MHAEFTTIFRMKGTGNQTRIPRMLKIKWPQKHIKKTPRLIMLIQPPNRQWNPNESKIWNSLAIPESPCEPINLHWSMCFCLHALWPRVNHRYSLSEKKKKRRPLSHRSLNGHRRRAGFCICGIRADSRLSYQSEESHPIKVCFFLSSIKRDCQVFEYFVFQQTHLVPRYAKLC